MANNKKKGKGKTIVTVIAVAVVALVAFAVLSRPARTNYTDVSATTGDITTYFSFSGTIAANENKTVYADKSLQISEIKVTAGQLVKKDAVLMTTAAGAEILAPMDGTVANLFAAVDAQQMPGAQLCRIVDYTRLELEVKVDEYDLPAMAVGKDATITIHALAKDVAGKVTDVAREGVHQNGVTSFSASISLPNESDLRVGMTAEAKILNQDVKKVTLLPISAIQFRSDNSSFVYTGNGKRLPIETSVTLGVHDGTFVEIKSGLQSGDTILVPSVAVTGGGLFGGRMNNRDNQASAGTTSGIG